MKYSTQTESKIPGYCQLFLLIALLMVVWGILLPRVTQNAEVAARIVELEVKGIDPSAMYYTDLEISDEISFQVERAIRENPDALWKFKSD